MSPTVIIALLVEVSPLAALGTPTKNIKIYVLIY